MGSEYQERVVVGGQSYTRLTLSWADPPDGESLDDLRYWLHEQYGFNARIEPDTHGLEFWSWRGWVAPELVDDLAAEVRQVLGSQVCATLSYLVVVPFAIEGRFRYATDTQGLLPVQMIVADEFELASRCVADS